MISQQTNTETGSVSGRSLGHIFLTGCLFFGVSAQLLLKYAMLEFNVDPTAWFSYMWIFSGLICYAVGTGFWMLCLGHLELSYAYPFNALTFILILVASWLIFDDTMSVQRVARVLLICCGVALLPRGLKGNL